MHNHQTVSPAAPSRQKQRWAIGALIAATSASIVLSLSAWAGGDEPPASGPPGMHMMGGPDGMPFGGRHLNHMLDEAGATSAQREQIKQIVDKAQVDLKALHEQGRALHEQGLKLWAQPNLDSAEAEQLRQQMLAQHDKSSKRMLQLMLDVGKVLTPEQRAKIADQMQKHHADMMQRMKAHLSASQPGDGHGPHGHRQPQEQ